jgi:hypothetical protein
MGANWELILVRSAEAAICRLPDLLLPLADTVQPRIRCTLVANSHPQVPDVWALELLGVNKKPLCVPATPPTITELAKRLSVSSAHGKALGLSATFMAAELVGKELGEASYISYSDGSSRAIAVVVGGGNAARVSDSSSHPGEYGEAAVAVARRLLPRVEFAEDILDGFADDEHRTLAWRLLDGRQLLVPPVRLQ